MKNTDFPWNWLLGHVWVALLSKVFFMKSSYFGFCIYLKLSKGMCTTIGEICFIYEILLTENGSDVKLALLTYMSMYTWAQKPGGIGYPNTKYHLLGTARPHLHIYVKISLGSCFPHGIFIKWKQLFALNTPWGNSISHDVWIPIWGFLSM